MLKDVTLGKYYNEESLIHSLDPRTKLRFTIAYILLFLLDRNLPFYILMTSIFFVVLFMSKVPITYMLKGSMGIFLAILAFSAINIFTTRGDTLVNIGSLGITKEGLIKFGYVCWRMILLVLMSSILMYTTKPMGIADGLEKCFHISGNIAMGITIALRFISVLFEELDRIMKAQEARGADFRSGGPITRLKKMKTIIVPLFQNSIDRAGNLGEALDARCYKGGRGRTKLEPLVYSYLDMIAYAVMLFMLAMGVCMIV